MPNVVCGQKPYPYNKILTRMHHPPQHVGCFKHRSSYPASSFAGKGLPVPLLIFALLTLLKNIFLLLFKNTGQTLSWCGGDSQKQSSSYKFYCHVVAQVCSPGSGLKRVCAIATSISVSYVRTARGKGNPSARAVCSSGG